MIEPAISLRLERRDQLRDGGAERDHHAGLAGGGLAGSTRSAASVSTP